MRSSVADLAAGVLSLLFAAAFYLQSAKLSGVGHDYPMGLILFITLGGLFLLFRGIRKRLSGSDPSPEDAEPTAYGRLFFILAATVTYAGFISLVGFYIASTFILFSSAMVLNDADWGWKKRTLVAAIFTTVMCVSVWIVFVKFLYVPTPEGLLF